ncbi:MAG TPA: hypothetical protein VFC13_26490 [Actinomycetes bacterium]|nr:hypothetical protein [Actinomycetes bacterium]
MALLLLLGACTGPVRSANVYESKAGVTAETVASAVETARLAVQAAQDGDAYGRYLTQVLAEAEEEADAAQATFEGIQPPDHRADELRDRLDELVGQATDTLTELRTLARRGRFAELAEPAAPLAELAEELHAFAEAHA